MKTTSKIATWALPALMTLPGVASADSHEEAARPTAFPAEIFTCTYVDGKDRSDLDRVIARFNKWSDENDPDGYSAWVMTPQFYNQNIKLDVLWLGAWQSFEELGASQDTWTTKGGEMAEAFNKVVTCDNHVLFRGYTIMPPMQESPPPTGVVFFSSCTANEGAEPRAVYEAHVKWDQWFRDKGIKTASWAFVHDLGAGAPKFDYYHVRSFNNYSDMGTAGELLFNGGGLEVAMEMENSVTSCDQARVYDATLVRAGLQQQSE